MALPDGVAAPDFGQPGAAETVALAVRVSGRPVAVMLAERGDDVTGWHPAALAVFAQIAELKLELDLARRKMRTGQPAAARGAATEAAQPAGGTAQATPQVPQQAPPAQATAPEPAAAPHEAPPAVETAAPQPAEPAAVGGVDEPSAIVTVETGPAEAEENPDQLSARRYAKLIATDIRLYNEESVMLGRQNGDLAKRIGEHLKRGRETFMRRYSHLGPDGVEILHSAFVQVLAAGNAELLPPAE